MLKGENYCITQENIMAHEMIGLNVRVAKSSDPKRIGIAGKVVDETRNVFVVEKNGNEMILPKNECEFEFDLAGERVIVDGKMIVYRPEQRLKTLWRSLNG